jgi:flavin reductase (DIM6/NTAB) family NADH-FMN oxidoreductase RutF
MDSPVITVDPVPLKQAFSRLAAGTSVITLMGENQSKMGFTATAVTSVSVEPALILVCVNNSSRTIPVLKAGTRFVINLLTAEQQDIAWQFASKDIDKFAGVNYSLNACEAIYLEDTLACIECVPHAIHPAGDHHIVLGQVLKIRIGDDSPPLVFFRSRFMS